MEGIEAMAGWVASGKIKVSWPIFLTAFIRLSFHHVVLLLCWLVIKVRETVVDGFDKMPQALMGLFTGDNTGKMVVKA